LSRDGPELAEGPTKYRHWAVFFYIKRSCLNKQLQDFNF